VRAHANGAPMCAPCKRAAQPAALSRTDPAVIRQPNPTQVLVDGWAAGLLDRNGVRNLLLPPPAANRTAPGFAARDGAVTLDVVVAAVGRSNQGWLFDTKGLSSPAVYLDGARARRLVAHRLQQGRVLGALARWALLGRFRCCESRSQARTERPGQHRSLACVWQATQYVQCAEPHNRSSVNLGRPCTRCAWAADRLTGAAQVSSWRTGVCSRSRWTTSARSTVPSPGMRRSPGTAAPPSSGAPRSLAFLLSDFTCLILLV